MLNGKNWKDPIFPSRPGRRKKGDFRLPFFLNLEAIPSFAIHESRFTRPVFRRADISRALTALTNSYHASNRQSTQAR
jgi:hypothetical protein